MTCYKSNKQALIIAALIILLCLSLLIGSTLALFTGNGTDGSIGIITTAGEIKLDIVDAVDETTSLIGEFLQFQTTPQRPEILFEPGATYRTQGFKVKNTGDIPVNFRLYISNDGRADMEEFAKAFDIWITTDPDNKDPEDLTELQQFKARLEANKISDTTYYLFVRMRENAGNFFQDKSYEGIGVTVYAVQGNVEVKE